MSKQPKTPKDSAYWRAMKTGLKTLFGKRARITDLAPKKSGGKDGR
jgi:hypothetical protein